MQALCALPCRSSPPRSRLLLQQEVRFVHLIGSCIAHPAIRMQGPCKLLLRLNARGASAPRQSCTASIILPRLQPPRRLLPRPKPPPFP